MAVEAEAEAEADDLSWLDEPTRASCTETLRALFARSHVSMLSFDERGRVVNINAHIADFGGEPSARYRGVNLLEHPVLRRLGWSDIARRVLAGEKVDVTDTQWVTLFGGEERFVDLSAGPIVEDGRVVGGVGCMVDATVRHRALAAAASKRQQARELEELLVREVDPLMSALEEWARSGSPPSAAATARALATVPALSALIEDVRAFVRLEAFRPLPVAVELTQLTREAGAKSPARMVVGATRVFGDLRLLRRALVNLMRFAQHGGDGAWWVENRNGRVELSLRTGASAALLKELLAVSKLSISESPGPEQSLAAARRMIEMSDGEVRVDGESSVLVVSLPAAA
jgi:PAS domain S-box-containing protein